MVSRKRRNEEEYLYQDQLKRRRERVHTGKADMDVEEYYHVSLLSRFVEVYDYMTRKPIGLQRQVRSSITNEMMAVKQEKLLGSQGGNMLVISWITYQWLVEAKYHCTALTMRSGVTRRPL